VLSKVIVSGNSLLPVAGVVGVAGTVGVAGVGAGGPESKQVRTHCISSV